MKKLLLLFTFLISVFAQAQNSEIQYVRIKKNYDFQSEPNEFLINGALKQKFEDLGYIPYYDDQMPQEVRLNPCAEYVADLKRGSGSLSTTLILEIKNCKGEVIFSKEGTSRLKVYKKSYMEALQNVFKNSNIEILRKR